MSFKCSVFGHAYGDSEIERDREEDGSEVVTTIRETQACKRCGETRVVSENKEVTTLETAADIVGDDLGADGTAEDEELDATEPTEPPAEPAEPADDAEVIDDSEPAEEPGESTEPIQDDEPEPETAGAAEIVDAEPAEETDPETDDAVEHGSTSSQPQADDAGSGASEPSVADAPDDGVILDEEEESEVPEREPGAWPEEPDDGDDQWEPETEVDPTPDQQEIEPTASAVTLPEGEFHCPECDFTTSVAESSLRRGDFCPECHRGALEHVTE